MCHRVVNFVGTVEHGEGTRRTLSDRWTRWWSVSGWRDPTSPGESFGPTQNFSPGGYKRWHTVRTRYEDGKRTLWTRLWGGAHTYCIVIVCERVHAIWITYFGVEIYILVQQYIFQSCNIYISERQYIFQSSSTYFRAAVHISEEAVCTR